MVLKILYSYFSLANLTALAERFNNLLTAKFPDHPMIAPMLGAIKANMNLAVQAIGSTTKQSLTQEVQTADRKRDNSFRSLRDHVQAGLLRENEPYRLACETLWAEFEKNGLKLYSAPYDEETASLESLIRDLEKPVNLALMETINAVEWKDELDRDNEAFAAVSQQRSAARSTDDTVTDKVAFDQLKTSLELMCNMLNALYAVNDPEGIREVVEEVNQYIREATAAAKQSGSHVTSPGEDESDVPAPSAPQ